MIHSPIKVTYFAILKFIELY